MGTVGDKGQSHITIHYNTISPWSAKLHNMYVAGLTRVFTEHFVFKVSDNELHRLSKTTAFVAGTCLLILCC